MKSIQKSYTLNTSLTRVWDALVNPQTIDLWGGGPAKMSEKEGSEFSLWSGDIHGKNVLVKPEKELVQEWYSGTWEKPSIVKISLLRDKGQTIVELDHVDIPDEEAKEIDKGWDEYYFGPIKELVEKNTN
ncbi:SRPBCC domain-containing protein [Candidatus Gottesmanbacteria bacterium]|nr:SRPBCC domain-containing protein [Candidatus Gottesmanbacteria bacterium]